MYLFGFEKKNIREVCQLIEELFTHGSSFANLNLFWLILLLFMFSLILWFLFLIPLFQIHFFQLSSYFHLPFSRLLFLNPGCLYSHLFHKICRRPYDIREVLILELTVIRQHLSVFGTASHVVVHSEDWFD